MRKNLTLGLCLLTLFATACSNDLDSGSTTMIRATLSDSAIELDQSSVPSGTISISVTNEGSMVHEIEVFAGDQTDLPVTQGVADTSSLDLVDEIEDIVPGTSVTLDLDLPAGEYVILCNLPGHYQMGMVTRLTVTA
ncbi:MAG: cupredoxin domain-containing protein [Acidimicrobiia bacterium]|jgi:uncharacterized cupredoxin-like copper-binding protein